MHNAQAQGVKVIAYDRPIPDGKADFYVSFDNEGIGKAIAASLVEHLKAMGVPTNEVGVLQINGSPTDAAAGLIKKGSHEGLAMGQYKTLAEFDTPNWAPTNAQQWAAGQIARFGKQIIGVVAANDGTAGGAIAAFKAAGVNPVPPVTGNDARSRHCSLSSPATSTTRSPSPARSWRARPPTSPSQLLKGETPKATTTLFNSPSQLFVPAVVTAENLKAEIIDKRIQTAARALHGRLCRGLQEARHPVGPRSAARPMTNRLSRREAELFRRAPRNPAGAAESARRPIRISGRRQ